MKSLHDSISERESTWGWVWALWPRASCLAPGWWCCSAWDSGFPGASLPRGSALLQKERQKGGEAEAVRAQMCSALLGTSQPLWGSYKGANQLWMWLYSKGCLVLLGQASSQVSADMKQTLILLGNNKGFLTLMLRHSLGYFGWQTFYLWYRLGWPALRFTPCKP